MTDDTFNCSPPRFSRALPSPPPDSKDLPKTLITLREFPMLIIEPPIGIPRPYVPLDICEQIAADYEPALLRVIADAFLCKSMRFMDRFDKNETRSQFIRRKWLSGELGRWCLEMACDIFDVVGHPYVEYWSPNKVVPLAILSRALRNAIKKGASKEWTEYMETIYLAAFNVEPYQKHLQRRSLGYIGWPFCSTPELAPKPEDFEEYELCYID